MLKILKELTSRHFKVIAAATKILIHVHVMDGDEHIPMASLSKAVRGSVQLELGNITFYCVAPRLYVPWGNATIATSNNLKIHHLRQSSPQFLYSGFPDHNQ